VLTEWSTPGQRWQRIALALMSPLAGAAVWMWWGAALHGAAAILLSITAFLFGVLSFAPVYRAWMAFGERANRIVVGFLFLVIYAVIVPIFSLLRLGDRFGIRGQTRRSFWVERPRREESVESMLRMG
jgi:hypothetical protein